MKYRNLFLAILLCICTLGLYIIYWFICLTNDSNKMSPQNKTASGGVALLFVILTFGIYLLYWNYKLGKKVGDSGGVYLLLCLMGLGGIVYLLAQSRINNYVRYPV